ncbi:MAG: sugar phosphate nucleotidyltransferase [Candidatus Falkowbacteria bacterium]|nr:sugar phosphate nucleotidyltransferase [Candidatus Falkowbacteria bacterium]
MQKIKTAVIPVAGWGTRFLPITKTIPKEMLPLGNKPIILHVVEEVVASGIKNIIFVVSQHKQVIESFFTDNEMLDDYFEKIGAEKEVVNLKKITEIANFTFVYTKNPHGNSGALGAVRNLLANEPFVLVWSDEVILSKQKPRIKQCLEAFEKYNKPVISAVKIADPKKRSRYGMASLKDLADETEIKEISNIVEKPAFGTEPSEYATHGAYVLTPEIFTALDQIPENEEGEVALVDVINIMKEKTGLLAKIIPDGHYLDCGNPVEYLYSQVDYYANYSEYSAEVLEYFGKGVCKRF